MREILFRAKRVGGIWVQGDLRQVDGKAYILDYDTGDNGVSEQQRIFDIAYEVDPSTVGQYTGLIDKNGKRIFEGDIYHQGDPNIKYIVEWHDTALMGRQVRTSGSCAGLSYWQSVICVIGNVYDNPELLEVSHV